MLIINNQNQIDVTEVIVLVVTIILSTYSLSRYGYQIWFHSDKFLEEAKRNKENARSWFSFVSNLTSVETDLLIAKAIFLFAFLVLLAFIVLLILKLSTATINS